MITEQQYDRLAARTLERILRAFDDVDPDVVEAIPSEGVVRFDFQGRRAPWVVNTQRGALQIWLAAERQAWHFAHAGVGDELRWVSTKSDEELFDTLRRLFAQHAGIDLDL